jgi:hypothetical protein
MLRTLGQAMTMTRPECDSGVCTGVSGVSVSVSVCDNGGEKCVSGVSVSVIVVMIVSVIIEDDCKCDSGDYRWCTWNQGYCCIAISVADIKHSILAIIIILLYLL